MSNNPRLAIILAGVAVALLALPPQLNAGIGDGLQRLNPFAATQQESLAPNSIRFINKRAAKRIRVESIRAARTETDTLRVDVVFYNTAAKPMQLAVRSLFFDEHRTLAESAGAWRTIHVQPRSVASFTARSSSRGKAASFIIEVQGDTANGY